MPVRRDSQGGPQHGLAKQSARKHIVCEETYVGLSFRLKQPGSESINAYKETHNTNRSSEVKSAELKQLEEGQSLLTWGAIVSDGVGTIDSGSDCMVVDLRDGQAEGKDGWKEARRVAARIVSDAREVAVAKSMVIQILAVSEPLPAPLLNCPHFFPLIYAHLNAIPFLIPSSISIFDSLPAPSPEYSATSAVTAAMKHLHPAIHSAVTVGMDEKTHKVQVDAGGKIVLASLEQYEQSTSEALWSRFMALVRHVKGTGIKFVRVSATPQGGGVALLQNALVRLWKLLNIDGFWLVPEGHPVVFDVTKAKFHNVLQGVQDNELTEKDKDYFEAWTKANFEHFWNGGEAGETFEEDRITVVDDPQLVALIPLLKKKFPKMRTFFRSHIQIQSNLTDDPSTLQHATWNYLFSFIKDTDAFLAHPVDFFVPKNVKDVLPVFYMPPSTDPLDGLNKPIGNIALTQLREVYNSLSKKQCGVEVDWDRGYIIQVARFDPSKGLPHLLAGYLGFRKRLEDKQKGSGEGEKKPPMLVVTGHGSVDDPDGTAIYEQLHEIVQSEEYKLVVDDISIVRAPPSDTLLGALMQGAWCATQLSTREGFESKVSEAVLKRVPIIASTAGGIPLQVKHGVNGWHVPPSDPDAVADILYKFYTGEVKLDRLGSRPDNKAMTQDGLHKPEDQSEGGGSADLGDKEANELDPNATADLFVSNVAAPQPSLKPDSASPSEDFFTIGNAARWLLLFSLMSGKAIDPANHSESAGGKGDEEVKILEGMGLSKNGTKGGKEGMRAFDGRNVWDMLMREEMGEGEGEVKLGSEAE